jgi:hypothetical protein
LIAKSQPLQSQDLAINPEPSIPQNLNPPKEEEIQPFEIPCEDDLFDAIFGSSLNFRCHKRPSSEYNSNPLTKRSLKKRPYSHVGHWEEFKGGMSSDVIEGELSHLANPIFSPSMTTLDVLSKPISQPILDPDDLSCGLSSKPHDDPRNPLRQPKHRSHEDHKDDKKEQR